MPSRIVIRGRPWWQSPDFRVVDIPGSVRNSDGELVSEVDLTPIPPDSPERPFREGQAYQCPDDGVVYRVVSRGRLTGAGGWGAVDFWLDRYACSFADLRDLAERGLLDAAMEAGSPTKKFRCRDERRVADFLRGRFPRRKHVVRLPRRP